MTHGLFVAVIVLAVVELIMSGSWVPFYFQTGIPLFREAFHCDAPPAIPLDALASACAGGMAPPMLFEEIEHDEVAFREAIACVSWLNYTPIMRGLIRIDRRESRVTVRGHANWTFLGVLALLLTYLPSTDDAALLVAFVAVIAGGIYLIQSRRYKRIARTLQDICSRAANDRCLANGRRGLSDSNGGQGTQMDTDTHG